MARKPPRSPEERLSRAQRSMTPGTLAGRVASATPLAIDLTKLAPRTRVSVPKPGPPDWTEFRLDWQGLTIAFTTVLGITTAHYRTLPNTLGTHSQDWTCSYGGTFSDIGVFAWQVADGNGIPVSPLLVLDWRTGPVSLNALDFLPFSSFNVTDGSHVTQGTYSGGAPAGLHHPIFHLDSHYLLALSAIA